MGTAERVFTTPPRPRSSAPDTYRDSNPTTDLAVGTDPLTENRYNYVNGDPVNADDATGHCQDPPDGDQSNCPDPDTATNDYQHSAAESDETNHKYGEDTNPAISGTRPPEPPTR